eukprot:6483561-Amphidinium_carterae.1
MRDYLERALRIEEDHYGPDHPEVGKTLNNLATASAKLSNLLQARQYLNRAWQIFEASGLLASHEAVVTKHNLVKIEERLRQEEHQQPSGHAASSTNSPPLTNYAVYPDCLEWPDWASETKRGLQQQGRDFYESNAGNPKLANLVQKRLQKARVEGNVEDEYKYSWAFWASLKARWKSWQKLPEGCKARFNGVRTSPMISQPPTLLMCPSFGPHPELRVNQTKAPWCAFKLCQCLQLVSLDKQWQQRAFICFELLMSQLASGGRVQ